MPERGRIMTLLRLLRLLRLLLLLLLLLLSSLGTGGGTVLDHVDTHDLKHPANDSSGFASQTPKHLPVSAGNGPKNGTDFPPEDEDHCFDIYFPHIMSVLALLLLMAMVVAGMHFRTKRKGKKPTGMKKDEYITTCDSRKIPTPMFEDDIPSVLELEMEDMEKWMVKTEPQGITSVPEKENEMGFQEE